MNRIRLLIVTSATLLLLVQAGGVLAQTPEPIERTPEMEEHAAEFAAAFPESIGGASLLENLEINVGQELIGAMDPSDPEEAADIAQLPELAEAAGATLAEAAPATSYAPLGADAYATIIALQIRGGDIAPALPLFVAAFEEDLPGALVEETQVGDVDVIRLSSAEDPEGGSFVILGRGDAMGLVAVPPEFLEETIGSLPES